MLNQNFMLGFWFFSVFDNMPSSFLECTNTECFIVGIPFMLCVAVVYKGIVNSVLL